MAFVPEDIMFITFSSIEGSSVVNEFFCITCNIAYVLPYHNVVLI